MTLPAAPYTYDDPRILYDEICFFYDGGYDSVCLTGPIFIGRGKYPSKICHEKLKDFFNFFIEYKLLSVNCELYEPNKETEWYKFTGINDAVEIIIDNVKIDITKPMIEGKFIEIVNSIINYSGSLESKKINFENILVSSSFYISENKELKIVENVVDSFKDYQISCELIKEE